MVETREFVIDRSTFTRAAFRTYLSRLLRLFAAVIVASGGFLLLGQTNYAIIFFVLALVLPPLAAWTGIRKVLSSPLTMLPCVSRFTEDAFEQLSGGERRSMLKYAELYYVDQIPEGLRIWLVKGGRWFFLDRAAFASPEDFQSACDLLIKAGKMKAP